MDLPSSVLISYRFVEDEWTAGPRGTSGTLLSDSWVLAHGSALQPAIDRSADVLDFVLALKPGELTPFPKKLSEALNFRVFRDTSRGAALEGIREQRGEKSRRKPQRMDMQEHEGRVAVAWKCPLLKATFEEFFVSWNFDEVAKFKKPLLLPVFLLLSLGAAGELPEPKIPPAAERILARFARLLQEKPTRGASLQIESTPFANPIFIDSLARGVVSNTLGDDDCLIMTDANAFPGCEGGPVYILRDCGLRVICGMVIAPLSWCRGEWVDYTFVANLAPCLEQIFRKDGRSLPNIITDVLDRCVAVVGCGSRWGTATLLDRDTGTFVTCSHVLAEAPKSAIKIAVRRGRSASLTWARLVYRTAEGEPYDVAVIRIKSKDVDRSLRAIRLADDAAVRGEAVVSAGFPFFSSTRPTISSGNVSKSLKCMLQTTCCAQSGASGGPIVRRATGEMLGIIVCNAISANNATLYPRLSMAVPVAVLRGPLQEYLRTGDPNTLQDLASNDATVRKTWELCALLPSKI